MAKVLSQYFLEDVVIMDVDGGNKLVEHLRFNYYEL